MKPTRFVMKILRRMPIIREKRETASTGKVYTLDTVTMIQ